MSTYVVYPGHLSAVGTLNETLLKEDVSDLISNLWPSDYPLQQALGSRPMSSVFTEYGVDTYSNITRSTSIVGQSTADPATTYSARPEGYSATSGTPQYPAKLKSVAEIHNERFDVSGTERAMAMYGIDDRFGYESMKTMQKVVNDFETSFWWSKGTPPEGLDVDSGAGFTVRQTQGLMWWILKSGLERARIGATPGACSDQATFADGHGNNFGTGNATLGRGAGSWAYNANGTALDRAMFKERLMGPWWQLTGRGGAGSMGFASPRVKNLFSEFALSVNGQINERTIDAAAKRVVDTVDWYETDYGVVSISMSRYLSLASETISVALGSGTATVACDEALVFIHPDHFKIGKVRGVSFVPLAKVGDLDSGMIVGEQALICTNPQAAAAIVNCIP